MNRWQPSTNITLSSVQSAQTLRLSRSLPTAASGGATS
jgi:hypothetical protein